jgi:hypothetical protein
MRRFAQSVPGAGECCSQRRYLSRYAGGRSKGWPGTDAVSPGLRNFARTGLAGTTRPLRRHRDPAPSPWNERPCRALVRRLHWGRPTPYDRGVMRFTQVPVSAPSRPSRLQAFGPSRRGLSTRACRDFRNRAEPKSSAKQGQEPRTVAGYRRRCCPRWWRRGSCRGSCRMSS